MTDYSLIGEWALYRNDQSQFVTRLQFKVNGDIVGPSSNERYWEYVDGQVAVLDDSRVVTTLFSIVSADGFGPKSMEGVFAPSIPSGQPIMHILVRIKCISFAHNGRLRHTASTISECEQFEQDLTDYSIIIEEGRQVQLPPPIKLINGSERANFFENFTGRYDAEEVRCDVIHDAWVFGGSVIADRNQVPLNSTTYHARRPYHYNATWDESGKTLKIAAGNVEDYVEEPLFVINTLSDVNFAHWLVQELPTTLMLERIRSMGLLERPTLFMAPPDLVAFRAAHLRDLRIDYPMVSPGRHHSTKRYRRLYVPSTHRLAHIFAFSNLVGETFRSLYEAKPPQQDRGLRLFFSRRDVGNSRGFSNEDQVAKALEKNFNFIRVDPGHLSEVEKRSLIGKASIIMAVHGGSLHNVMYTPPGCTVVEIFNENHHNWWNYHIAALTGRAYAAICLPLPPEQKKLPVERIVQDVDIPLFLEGIREILLATEVKPDAV